MENLNKKIYLTMIISVLMLLVGLGTFLLLSKQTKQIVPTSIPKEGSMTIQTAEKNNVSGIVNIPLQVTISSTSMGYDVVGYDIILNYDQTQLDIIQTTSLLPEFSLFKTKLTNYMMITGSKKPSATAQTVWVGKEIVSLTVVPKKSGTVSLNVLAQQGKETTKFVDNKSTIHYPQVNSINIQVIEK